MTVPSVTRELQKLAGRYGVQTAYYDMNHRRQQASTESLLEVLRLTGAPVATLHDVPSALREYELRLWQQPLEPVSVAWEGTPLQLQVKLPADKADGLLYGYLTLETGEEKRLNWAGADLPVIESTEIEGARYTARLIQLQTDLPPGYHRFSLELPGQTAETLLITSPVQAYNYDDKAKTRFWGVFLPLYSLYTERSWGVGDLSDLETLAGWAHEMGGAVVATLPLLPAFLDEPFQPSPYAPVSRLAWNELYVDVNRAPMLAKCSEAQDLINTAMFKEELQALRSSPLIDYRGQMKLKRRILERLSECFFAESNESREPFGDFASARPEIADYARFRAAHERIRKPWQMWPRTLRDGVLSKGDYDERILHYYLYTQWLLHNQMESLAERAGKSGPGLYLDFPLGVHPGGYDTWRYRHLFIHRASVGAPPDPVFKCGQDWECPPLNPEMIRKYKYDYYISCIRHHLKCAGILRIDHVMGLHRLFIIPHGMEPCDGVYLRYHSEEFYAILSLESHRARTLIVGEDLGTVPPDVRPAMKQHGLHRNYVVQYELCTNCKKPVPAVPFNTVASVNTHDMPPFAAFWKGLDIGDRLDLDLLDNESIRIEQKNRESIKNILMRFLRRELSRYSSRISVNDLHSLLKAILTFLSASRATVVLINLEDLWLETESQNFPGTGDERPNWRRKARYGFETFSQMQAVSEVLRRVDNIRKQGVDDDTKKEK